MSSDGPVTGREGAAGEEVERGWAGQSRFTGPEAVQVSAGAARAYTTTALLHYYTAKYSAMRVLGARASLFPRDTVRNT